MVEHVKLRALPIDGNDMSGAIRVAFASIPPEDQAALLTTRQVPAPPRLRRPDPPPLPAHCRPIAAPVVRLSGPSGPRTNMGGRSAGDR
jgi:hypothetical protein